MSCLQTHPLEEEPFHHHTNYISLGFCFLPPINVNYREIGSLPVKYM